MKAKAGACSPPSHVNSFKTSGDWMTPPPPEIIEFDWLGARVELQCDSPEVAEMVQAREIIDHSMLSQKEMLDDVRRIKRKTTQLAAGTS